MAIKFTDEYKEMLRKRGPYDDKQIAELEKSVSTMDDIQLAIDALKPDQVYTYTEYAIEHYYGDHIWETVGSLKELDLETAIEEFAKRKDKYPPRCLRIVRYTAEELVHNAEDGYIGSPTDETEETVSKLLGDRFTPIQYADWEDYLNRHNG